MSVRTKADDTFILPLSVCEVTRGNRLELGGALLLFDDIIHLLCFCPSDASLTNICCVHVQVTCMSNRHMHTLRRAHQAEQTQRQSL